MTRFRLCRADSDTAKTLGARLGDYATWAEARAARDWDVLRQLERAGGRRIELGHAIVDLDRGGPPRRRICSVGQPPGWPVDVSAELAATAEWLARLSRRD
jgi:hypothetical protein